ncbi:hypothetical protein Nepgr_006689 [Nepenthes gracilis]|uniref:Uncharacterized protein n=1 Tax=Nepenthes gracilis TaxID=150966 RepID=A0AAD3S5I4_NEPGR|nr:hypothetical protein Nepgr_006689 [Nepenthes gracilis]
MPIHEHNPAHATGNASGLLDCQLRRFIIHRPATGIQNRLLTVAQQGPKAECSSSGTSSNIFSSAYHHTNREYKSMDQCCSVLYAAKVVQHHFSIAIADIMQVVSAEGSRN